ncbi:MAG: carbohydrate kinase family protein [Acidobacteriota bacterium]|nr:carbohydrate kinase family protein [Acidobacteriota bacterium]
MHASILVAGELNVDLVLQNALSFPAPGRETLAENCSLTLGSASAICAAALAKLGHQVDFIGKAGQDSWGDLCLSGLTELGVNCSLVQRDSGLKTGVTVSITSPEDRAMITYLGAIAALEESDVTDENLRGHRHLHVSSFYLQRGLRPGLKRLFTRAREAGLTTSLDPGFDPEERWDRDLIDVLEEVDVFLPNEVELAAISGKQNRTEALQSFQNGKTLIVAKLGADGCMAMDCGAFVKMPAFQVQPIDTTGAGDAFNAGFLHAWLAGEGVRDGMRFAAACGALSTQGLGGTANQPTDDEAQRFMQ